MTDSEVRTLPPIETFQQPHILFCLSRGLPRCIHVSWKIKRCHQYKIIQYLNYNRLKFFLLWVSEMLYTFS